MSTLVTLNGSSVNMNIKAIKDTLKTELGTVVQIQTDEVLIPRQKGQQVQKIVCSTTSSYLQLVHAEPLSLTAAGTC